VFVQTAVDKVTRFYEEKKAAKINAIHELQTHLTEQVCAARRLGLMANLHLVDYSCLTIAFMQFKSMGKHIDDCFADADTFKQKTQAMQDAASKALEDLKRGILP
jgi:hypothetical protein